MKPTSFNDIGSMINQETLPFIIDRLDDEGFDYVGELTIWCKKNFRIILHDYFTGRIDLKFAHTRCCSEINPPPNLRQNVGWQLRMLKGEISKIFTLGYGDICFRWVKQSAMYHTTTMTNTPIANDSSSEKDTR